jgi:hypothetical protein
VGSGHRSLFDAAYLVPADTCCGDIDARAAGVVGKDGVMSLQCAPCLSDLALVRDSVTTIGGTATCTAHAVLMRYPSDDPGRRRKRLADLRTLAEARVVDATGLEKEKLELLAQEYAVAEAMDLGAPDRTGPGRGSDRPRRGRDRERRPGEPREGQSREGRPPREPRPDRGPRPEGGQRPDGENRPDVGAPTPASDVIAAEGGVPAGSDRPTGVPSTPAPTEPSEPSTPAPVSEAPSAPAPVSEAPSAPAPAEPAPSAPANEALSAPAPTSEPAAAPAPPAPAPTSQGPAGIPSMSGSPSAAPSPETAATPQTSRDDSAFGTSDSS